MTLQLFAQIYSRRAWLLGAGLGVSILSPTAVANSGSLLGKDDTVQDIMHLLKIHASVEQVYGAITTADGIRQWWTRDAVIEPRVGAAGEFGFYGKRFVAKVLVEELNPLTHVRWKVTNSAWPGNDIEFDLQDDGNDTTLLFAHRGFPRADAILASATTRWGFYLLSLKRFMQSGEGTPNPNDGELG